MKYDIDILALCSGGFDSVILLNWIKESFPDKNVLALHFNYKQKSAEQERKSTEKVCKKLNYDLKVIDLPMFDWTNSDFYSENYRDRTGEYLEMRNLVFISYALSVCESLKIPTMYMATLKSISYYDTSDAFLSKIGGIAKDKDIKLITPFSEMDKYDLANYAFHYNIQKDDFFTCDNPINGKPCGKCPDCLALNDIFESIKVDSPIKAWVKNFDPHSKQFAELFKKEPIWEIRLLVNNDCQLKCKHCYYGFDEMLDKRMTLDEYISLFKQAKELGINAFHYSGKEPLYDDFMFKVNDELLKIIPDAYCSIVTNGINVPKYAKQLKSGNFMVCISIDGVEDTSLVRTTKETSYKALDCLIKHNIPFQVFVDIHANNYDKLNLIADYLCENYGVKFIYFRNIVSVGNASSNDFPKLTLEQLNISYLLAKECADSHPLVHFAYTMGVEYTYQLLLSDKYEVSHDINNVLAFAEGYIYPNFYLHPEAYCGKYENQITITPDGYIHGCASEVSCKHYDKISVGNIRDYSLADLINRGKDLALKTNINELNDKGELKFFNCTCCNPIDNE